MKIFLAITTILFICATCSLPSHQESMEKCQEKFSYETCRNTLR